MDKGWICIYRNLLDKPIWQTSTPEQKCILITLLLMANHSEREWEWKGEKFICKAGQFITSLDGIVKKTGAGISTRNVRTAIDRFEKYEFLTNESTNKNRLITICNWEEYQSKYFADDKQNDKQLTSNRQAADKQLTTNNNDNNDNNLNKEIPTNVGTKKDDEDRLAELARRKEEQKRKLDAAKAATLKRRELFREELSPYIVRYGDAMISKFFQYWTEMNRAETKMKFELQKTWDLALRLGTWHNREPINRKRDLFSQPPSVATTPDNRPRDREGNLLQ